MSGESQFAKQVRSGIYNTDVCTHVSFIESRASSPGIPDTNIATNEIETFVELKSELTVNKLPKIRASQVRWFKKRVAVGVKAFVFVRLTTETGDLYLLIPGGRVDLLNHTKTVEGWINLSCAVWRNQMVWYDFLCKLEGKHEEN